MLDLLKELRTQASELRQAPTWSLFLVLIIGAVISWQAVEWEYKREIETLHEQRQTALDKAALTEQQLKIHDEQSRPLQQAKPTGVTNQPGASVPPVTNTAAAGPIRSGAISDPLKLQDSLSELRTPDIRVADIAVLFKPGVEASIHATVAAAIHGRIVKAAHDNNAAIMRIDSVEDWKETVQTLKGLPDVAGAVWGPDLYRDAGEGALGKVLVDVDELEKLVGADQKIVEIKTSLAATERNEPKYFETTKGGITAAEGRNAMIRSIGLVGVPVFALALALYFLLRIRRTNQQHENPL